MEQTLFMLTPFHTPPQLICKCGSHAIALLPSSVEVQKSDKEGRVHICFNDRCEHWKVGYFVPFMVMAGEQVNAHI